jgi:hypothetical protein
MRYRFRPHRRLPLAPASTHSDFTARPTHQGAAQSHEPRCTACRARIICLQVAAVGDRDDKQRQAHLASAEYR